VTWTVYECGTPCKIGRNGDITGTITAINIRFQNMLYEVTWWDDATKKTEWFNPEELTVDSAPAEHVKTVSATSEKL